MSLGRGTSQVKFSPCSVFVHQVVRRGEGEGTQFRYSLPLPPDPRVLPTVTPSDLELPVERGGSRSTGTGEHGVPLPEGPWDDE